MLTKSLDEKKEDQKVILKLRQIVRDLDDSKPNKLMAQQRILDAIDWINKD